MKYLVMTVILLLLVASLSFSCPIVETTPIFLRLKFDQNRIAESDSFSKYKKYLWERRLLPNIPGWAEESTDTDTAWRLVKELPRKIKVGLVLAGGGDRGIAHIGVLRALEENNIPIDAIAGTSMGAIVGGFYACGYSIDALETIVLDSIQWRSIFSDQAPLQYLPIWERLRDKPREPGLNWDMTWNFRPWPPKKLVPSALSFKPGAGLRTAQKFTDEIAKRTITADYLAGFQFDSLPISYGAVLTNMTTRKPDLKLSGTVSTAARASGSLPLIFEPMKIGGVDYVDGMVMDNLPVDAFRKFDQIRAPDTLIKISGDTVDFVIAVDPIKRTGVKDELEKKPELSGSMGIGVMNQTSTMARDFYIQASWDTADVGIDVDVEGAFDFSPKLLKDKIRKGYDAAWDQMCCIKKDLVERESQLEPTYPRTFYRIKSIKLKYQQKEGVVDVKDIREHKEIFKAIRVHEGSYIEKIDLCDILRRIHLLGDFSDVALKVEEVGGDWVLVFFMRKKATRQNAKDSVYCRLRGENVNDSLKENNEKLIDSIINRQYVQKNRILDFNETKYVVEKALVEQGYLAPRVNSVEYDDTSKSLTVFVHSQGRLKGVQSYDAGSDSIQKQTSLTQRVDTFFKNNASPWGATRVFNTCSRVYTRFNLKTISIENMNDSMLKVGFERKPGHAVEFPSISLEKDEGISLFGEARCREWAAPFCREWLSWSTYLNYTQNFPLKLAEQLPQGQRFGFGMQRCNYKIVIPEWNAYWMTLRYSSGAEPTIYDQQFEEYCGRLALPIYWPWPDLLALIPNVQWQKVSTHPLREHGEWPDCCFWRFVTGFQTRLVNLDRIIFPESGFMIDLDASSGRDLDEWWRCARIKAVCIPATYRIQGVAMSVFTLRGFMSYFTDNTPLDLRYSLGGMTPIGSYRLRRFDAEDLPGFRLDEFIEPWMWKIGASYRIALIEKKPLDLRFILYLVASYDLASSASCFTESLSPSNLKHCPTGGFQVDMSYFNIGLVFIGKQKKLLDNFHLSVVYYGLGF